MKINLVHYRTCVCNINYHIVWSVKYRRKVLTQEIESYLNDLARLIAEEKFSEEAFVEKYINIIEHK